jgi:pimeloyl-ACP methyl ester carboxylesterase
MIKKITTSDGETVSYLTTPSKKESTDTQTVILLHGLGGDLSVWSQLEKVLTENGYSCISIDIRGHGESSRPKEPEKYQFSRLSLDIVEVMSEEKLSSVIVVGHCLGAIVGQQLAREFPTKVSKLVMLAPLNRSFLWIKWLEKKHIFTKSGETLLKVLPSGNSHKRFAEQNYLNGSTDFSGRRIFGDLIRTSLKSYGNVMFQVLNLDLVQHLTKPSKVPTLILLGKKDKVVSVKAIEKNRHLLAGAKIVILEKGNHMLLMTAFDQIVHEILEWLPDQEINAKYPSAS